VFAIGAYNGQTANKPELNKDKHIVARLSCPFQVKSQIFEPAIQAYTGKYVMPDDLLSSGVKVRADKTYLDQRMAASFILYPRPFGIMAEYNYGRGPQFNKHTDSIELRTLQGGYVTLNYMIRAKSHLIFPFVRGQFYDGGKKHEKDARSYLVKELEIGLEWQPIKFFEIVMMYTLSSRRFEDYAKQDNLQNGRLLRIQAQVNF
jgi:hypothetical protein